MSRLSVSAAPSPAPSAHSGFIGIHVSIRLDGELLSTREWHIAATPSVLASCYPNRDNVRRWLLVALDAMGLVPPDTGPWLED